MDGTVEQQMASRLKFPVISVQQSYASCSHLNCRAVSFVTGTKTSKVTAADSNGGVRLKTEDHSRSLQIITNCSRSSIE